MAYTTVQSNHGLERIYFCRGLRFCLYFGGLFLEARSNFWSYIEIASRYGILVQATLQEVFIGVYIQVWTNRTDYTEHKGRLAKMRELSPEACPCKSFKAGIMYCYTENVIL